MTSTIRHRLGLLLHGVPDLLKIESDGPANLEGWYFTVAIGPVDRICADA
jgi:hypothetical protein